MTDMHREAFERWYSQEFYDGMCPAPEWSEKMNTYIRFEDHLSWNAWKAGIQYVTEQVDSHE